MLTTVLILFYSDRFNRLVDCCPPPPPPPAQASKIQYVTTSFKILHLLILRIALHSVLYGLNGKKNLKKYRRFGLVLLSCLDLHNQISHCDYEALITSSSMITDRIGRHEVLLPINHNFNKICDI